MLLSLLIAFIVGTVLSFISFFKPVWLSTNITELESLREKYFWSFFSVELTLIFTIYLRPDSISEWGFLFFTTMLFFIACVDVNSCIISNKLLIVAAIVPIINLTNNYQVEPLFAMLSVCIIGGMLYVGALKIWDKKIFGLGDLKLISILALFLGWEFLGVVYVAIILGGIFAIVGILFKKLSRNSKIPMAPFLFVAFIINHLAIIEETIYFIKMF